MYKQWLLVTVLFFFLSGSSSDEPKIRRLSRTCVVITVSGTNCVAVAGTKGVAVIDTGPSPLAGKTLRKTVQNLFPRQEIIACINTHPHWDHVYGNEAFKDVPIFGMAETGAIMTAALERQKRELAGVVPASVHSTLPPPGRNTGPTADPCPEGVFAASGIQEEENVTSDAMRNLINTVELTVPNCTFEMGLRIDLGSRTIRLARLGSGHSFADVLVVVQEEGVWITGDVFTARQLPVLSGEKKYDLESMLSVIHETLNTSNPVIVVPGHGDVIPGKVFEQQVTYLENLWNNHSGMDATETAAADSIRSHGSQLTVAAAIHHRNRMDIGGRKGRLGPESFQW